MGRVVSNDVSAIIPEIWSKSVQVPLYKSLVALEICNTRLEDDLKYGDTIHIPRFGNLSAQTYTPGTPLSATNLDWAFDNLIVSSYKHATFYINYLCTLGETLSIKLRKLLGNLTETISSETQKWGRSTTIIGVSWFFTI